METQFYVLEHQFEMHFHDQKPATECNKKGHVDRDTDYEVRRQRAIEKEMGCEIKRFSPDDLDFDIFKKINKIHHHHERNVKEEYDELKGHTKRAFFT